MVRAFETNEIRMTKELCGAYDFEADSGYKCLMPVPGVWEQNPELINFRGIGTYKKEINVLKDSNLVFEFYGVSHTARVYLDNEFLGEHYNAYTKFEVLAKNVKKGVHVLKVEVSNEFSEKSSLHVENDYYTYGGITRGVVMNYVGDAYIERGEFVPFFEDGEWKIKAAVYVKELCGKNIKAQVCVNVCQKEFFLGEMELCGEKCFKGVISLGKAESWSHERPVLHKVHMLLKTDGDILDDLLDRIGLREVKLKNDGLEINGQSVFLKGFNRHEEYADFGCSVPFNIMMKDLYMMADMGANAVRTCHYPNDPLFLDLCDELGFFVWEENHARGLSMEQMNNPNFDRQCAECINEMITNHINHPSIVIWAVLNECESATAEGREKYKMQLNQIRALDSSRPVTFATCRHYTDLCLDLADIVSINRYFTWYHDIEISEGWEKEYEWAVSHGGENKPVIISEFGAGAIYGCRDRRRAKWSEEGQADIVSKELEYYLSRKEICGVFIWQFCDVRVTPSWSLNRPKTRNNKGIVDEYRREKLAYDCVKELFCKK